jgi:hypothetical protein
MSSHTYTHIKYLNNDLKSSAMNKLSPHKWQLFWGKNGRTLCRLVEMTTHDCQLWFTVSDGRQCNQSCQIFLCTTYKPKQEKYIKLPQNLPHGPKIYLMAIQCSECPKNVSTFSIPRPLKIYPNCDPEYNYLPTYSSTSVWIKIEFAQFRETKYKWLRIDLKVSLNSIFGFKWMHSKSI